MKKKLCGESFFFLILLFFHHSLSSLSTNYCCFDCIRSWLVALLKKRKNVPTFFEKLRRWKKKLWNYHRWHFFLWIINYYYRVSFPLRMLNKTMNFYYIYILIGIDWVRFSHFSFHSVSHEFDNVCMERDWQMLSNISAWNSKIFPTECKTKLSCVMYWFCWRAFIGWTTWILNCTYFTFLR